MPRSKKSRSYPSSQDFDQIESLNALLLVLVSEDKRSSSRWTMVPKVKSTVMCPRHDVPELHTWQTAFTHRCGTAKKGPTSHNKFGSNENNIHHLWCEEASKAAKRTKPESASSIGYWIMTDKEEYQSLLNEFDLTPATWLNTLDRTGPSEEAGESAYPLGQLPPEPVIDDEVRDDDFPDRS